MVILFLYCKCNSIPSNIIYPYQKKAAAIHHSPKRLKHYKRENSKTPFMSFYHYITPLSESLLFIRLFLLL